MLSMPSIVIAIEIQLLFWVLLRAHFNLLLGARANVILNGACENIFMPTNVNHFVLLT